MSAVAIRATPVHLLPQDRYVQRVPPRGDDGAVVPKVGEGRLGFHRPFTSSYYDIERGLRVLGVI